MNCSPLPLALEYYVPKFYRKIQWQDSVHRLSAGLCQGKLALFTAIIDGPLLPSYVPPLASRFKTRCEAKRNHATLIVKTDTR